MPWWPCQAHADRATSAAPSCPCGSSHCHLGLRGSVTSSDLWLTALCNTATHSHSRPFVALTPSRCVPPATLLFPVSAIPATEDDFSKYSHFVLFNIVSWAPRTELNTEKPINKGYLHLFGNGSRVLGIFLNSFPAFSLFPSASFISLIGFHTGQVPLAPPETPLVWQALIQVPDVY